MVFNLAYLLVSCPLFLVVCGLLGASIGRLPEHPELFDLVPVFGCSGSLFFALIAVLMTVAAAPPVPPVRRRR